MYPIFDHPPHFIFCTNLLLLIYNWEETIGKLRKQHLIECIAQTDWNLVFDSIEKSGK